MRPYWKTYKEHLIEVLSPWKRIWKISLDAGMTCPNLDGTKGTAGCLFCNNASFSPSLGQSHLSLIDQWTPRREALMRRSKAQKFLAYFQPYSNTYAPLEQLELLYRSALALPDCIGICIGTRPDCVSLEVIQLLDRLAEEGHYICLELGLQSAHDQTLVRVGRKDDFAQFTQVMNQCQGKNIEICIHLILGLPGENQEDWIATANELGRWKWHTVKIHPLHVVKETGLEKSWRAGRYIELDQNEYLDGVVAVLRHLAPTISIQRWHGEALGEWNLAPDWTGNRQVLENEIVERMKLLNAVQGDLFTGNNKD
jgi:uncharacterized protein